MFIFQLSRILWVLIINFNIISAIRLIIDSDGVYDDIRAISIAIASPNVNVLAITTVHGGVSVEQATANIARGLRANNKLGIPIYMGANDSIVPQGPVEVWEDVFGADGLGGVPQAKPVPNDGDYNVNTDMSAADAIIELTKNDKITLVCIGPLTNLALAIKKDSQVSNRIDKLVIMGGNYLGVGNTRTNSTAEFNFLMDPEAAQIVLSTVSATIIPWDTCFFKSFEYAKLVDFEESLMQSTLLSSFLNQITLKSRRYGFEQAQPYSFIDDIAIAVAIDPDVATKMIPLIANVEITKNSLTRGQVTIDWMCTTYNTTSQQFEAKSDKNNLHWLRHYFVKEYDVKKVNRMLMYAVTQKSDAKHHSGI